jgi:hypothetical protein
MREPGKRSPRPPGHQICAVAVPKKRTKSYSFRVKPVDTLNDGGDRGFTNALPRMSNMIRLIMMP